MPCPRRRPPSPASSDPRALTALQETKRAALVISTSPTERRRRRHAPVLAAGGGPNVVRTSGSPAAGSPQTSSSARRTALQRPRHHGAARRQARTEDVDRAPLLRGLPRGWNRHDRGRSPSRSATSTGTASPRCSSIIYTGGAHCCSYTGSTASPGAPTRAGGNWATPGTPADLNHDGGRSSRGRRPLRLRVHVLRRVVPARSAARVGPRRRVRRGLAFAAPRPRPTRRTLAPLDGVTTTSTGGRTTCAGLLAASGGRRVLGSGSPTRPGSRSRPPTAAAS